MRCLLRLVLTEGCGVSNLSVNTLREKYYGMYERDRFEFADPSRKYTLDLANPVDRSVREKVGEGEEVRGFSDFQ